MKILLIRPPRVKKAITIGEFMFCEPIALEGLYALWKDEHTVKIVDMMVDTVKITDLCVDFSPDVVGFTSLCVDVTNVLTLARQVKAHDESVITLVGGSQTFVVPSAFHDPAMDHVMRYTTKENLKTLFDHLQKGAPVPMIDGIESKCHDFESTGIKGRNEYLVPDRSSTARYRKHYSYFGYQPCAIMQTSQGCSKQCTFCLRWRIEGGKELPQPMPCVFEQIETIEEPTIMIFDNDFLCDGDRIHQLCDWLEETGTKKTFISYGSVSGLLKNRDAVARFAKNGFSVVLIGYESGNPRELTDYSKKTTVDDNLAAARFLKEIGVDAWASFILHPDWSVADFKQYRRYIRQLRPEITTMAPLTPFETLPMHRQYKDRLIIDRESYENWNFANVSIQPSKMSLRKYYWQVLMSHLYVNFYMNNTLYLIRKFGPLTLLRLLFGSIRLMKRYVGLMLKATRAHPSI